MGLVICDMLCMELVPRPPTLEEALGRKQEACNPGPGDGLSDHTFRWAPAQDWSPAVAGVREAGLRCELASGEVQSSHPPHPYTAVAHVLVNDL